VTVEFCQAEDGTNAMSVEADAREEVVFMILSHRSTR